MKLVKSKVSFYLIVLLIMMFFSEQFIIAQDYSTRDLNEQLVMATLWMQKSAEYRALCYQSFNLAKMMLDQRLKKFVGKKKLAVVVDLDEAVIDNTDYEAFLIGNNFGYSSKTWTPWMQAGQAIAVPGAKEFLVYAESKKVEVFYISNRKMVGYDGTEKNLKELGFPYVDKIHLLLTTDTSDKQPRRDIVAKDYETVLLIGDNLNDFTSAFANKSVEERFMETDKIKADFGTKFIVIPNPVYGDWEGAIYKYNWNISVAEMDMIRKEALRRWKYNP